MLQINSHVSAQGSINKNIQHSINEQQKTGNDVTVQTEA